mgnify:CR=1 FL=1
MTRAPTGFIAPRDGCIACLPARRARRCWSPASTRASRWTMRWRVTPGFAGLDPRDRAFVRLLLATTLRRLGEIDEVLARLIERPARRRQRRRPPGAAPGRRPAAVPRHARPRRRRHLGAAGRRCRPAASQGPRQRRAAPRRARGRGAAGRPRPGAAQHAALAVAELVGRPMARRRRAPSPPPI